MKKSNSRKKVAVAMNIMVIILEIIGLYYNLTSELGIRNLKYYTVLSNIFAMVMSIMFVVNYLRQKNEEQCTVPKQLTRLKYSACTCLAVTFVVVVTVLIPSYGISSAKGYLLEGANLYQHVLCPFAAIISFCFFEKDEKMTIKDNLLILLPTIGYAIIALILNFAKLLHGPYPFLYVYEQPVYMSFVWLVVILSMAYVLALILRVINGKGNKAKS